MSRNVAIECPKASYGTHRLVRGDVRVAPYQARRSSEDDLSGFDDVDISHLHPPPYALTSATASTSYDPHSDAPSPLEDFPPSPSTSHQRTLTGTFLDNLNRATTSLQHQASRASLHSPTKSLASFIPTRGAIESSASQPKIRALQNWFNASTRRHVSSDSESESGEEYGSDDDNEDDEEEEEEEEEEEIEEREKDSMMANLFNRGSSLTRTFVDSPRRSEASPTRTPTKTPSQPNASSKFTWLLSTQKNATMPPPRPEPVYHNPDDELLDLNISQHLFPHGPADPLAPSSFHDLLTTAEALLSRYQSSYRQLSTSLVDARSEQSAQEDELDEADTRVRHLKMQLETMAARASEHDAEMQKLKAELAFERKARQEEGSARKQSLLHDTTPRRRNRTSNSNLSIDSGFESECETDAASVFSRNCLSPTGTDQSSINDNDTCDTTPRGKQVQTLQRRSTHDKVRDGPVDLKQGGWGCTNCEGGAQAAVWGRLAKEREENRTLRHRVERLEEAVDGALNVVDGPWGL